MAKAAGIAAQPEHAGRIDGESLQLGVAPGTDKAFTQVDATHRERCRIHAVQPAWDVGDLRDVRERQGPDLA